MVHKAKIIGIIAIKGGVGKTTSLINLAYSLAHDASQRVLVVDGDFSHPSVGLHLGFTSYSRSLSDALRNPSKTKDSVYAHEFGFHVLLGSLSAEKSNPLRLKECLQTLKEYYDYILVDSSPNLNDETLSVMRASDSLFVVTTPDYPSLASSLRAIRLAKEKKTNIEGIILNQVRNKKYEYSASDVEKISKTPVLAVIQDTSAMLHSLSSISPFVKNFPKSKNSHAFRSLALSLCKQEYEKPQRLEKIQGYLHEDYCKLKTHSFRHGLLYFK